MEGSVLGSVFFGASFFILFCSFLILKKTDKVLNGVTWLVMDLITILCWGTLCAGILNFIKIPINIVSLGCVYLVSACGIIWKIYHDKEWQKYSWKAFDIIYVLFFGGILFGLLIGLVTPELDLVFRNSDAAVHFKNAMSIVRDEKLGVMYFAPLHSSLIIQTILPTIDPINAYKIFVVIDAAALILEAWFFMVLIRQYLKGIVLKCVGIVLGLLYVFGYPANSYLMTFFYWGLGVMLVGYVLVLLKELANREIKKGYIVFCLMLGCNAVTMCYMIFGPITYIAVFICLCMYSIRQYKLFSWNTVKLSLQVFALPCISAIWYCYFDFLKKQNYSISGILATDGGIYNELFINFIFVLPFVVFMLWYAVKEKHCDENIVFLLCFGVVAAILGIVVFMGKATSYYYFKLYYPIWMLCFVIAAQAIVKWKEKHRDVLITYGIIFLVLFTINFTKAEQKLMDRGTMLTRDTKVAGLFDIYNYNEITYKEVIHVFPDEYMQLCNYVLSNFAENESIPMVADLSNYTQCYWYEGITGKDSSNLYGWDYSIVEIENKFNQGEVDYFAVSKDSQIYQENMSFFDSFDKIWENERTFVAGWKK